jgi:hypothetical protein
VRPPRVLIHVLILGAIGVGILLGDRIFWFFAGA